MLVLKRVIINTGIMSFKGCLLPHELIEGVLFLDRHQDALCGDGKWTSCHSASWLP